MSVAVYVMPLATWLSGRFRTSWGPEGSGLAAGPQRSSEEVDRYFEAFQDQLGRLLPVPPEWDETGPARSGTVFSLEGFSSPFQLARQWAYRLKLPALAALEPPQVWLPADFEPVFRIPAPWNSEVELTVGSAGQVVADLSRLLEAIRQEERPDLIETGRVAARLREIAATGIDYAAPVIVEG